MRQFQIPLETYQKEICGQFNPVEFNADEWAQLAQDSGMKYMNITAKFCAGFAMWDSDVNDYDIVEMILYAKEPMPELKSACKKRDMLFGFYYAQAQDWGHPQGTRNYWDFGLPERTYLNGKIVEWWEVPGDPHLQTVKKYVSEKAIPQGVELLEKYDPDIIWFDTPCWLPPRIIWPSIRR